MFFVVLECDNDSFNENELEDFGEISTIALPDDGFIISDVIEAEAEGKLSEIELSCDFVKRKKEATFIEWVTK